MCRTNARTRGEEGRKERVAQRTTVAHRTQDTGTDLCLHSDNMEIVLRTLIGLFAWWQVSFELKYILVLVYCGMYEGIPTSLAACLSIIFRGPCKLTRRSNEMVQYFSEWTAKHFLTRGVVFHSLPFKVFTTCYFAETRRWPMTEKTLHHGG